jgi:hypothetical protein
MKINKKGILGISFITVIMTVGVVLILLIFILTSGIIKTFDKAKAGVKVYSENDVGLGNVFDYMASDKGYSNIVRVRFLVEKRGSIGDALMEVGYG